MYLIFLARVVPCTMHEQCCSLARSNRCGENGASGILFFVELLVPHREKCIIPAICLVCACVLHIMVQVIGQETDDE